MKISLYNNIKFSSKQIRSNKSGSNKSESKQLVILNKISKKLELSVIEPNFNILPKI